MKQSKRRGKKPFSLIPEKRLTELYKAMLECRMLQQQSKATGLQLADEALHCGVLFHVDKSDQLVAAETALTLRYLKREPLARLLRGAAPASRSDFHPLPAAKSSSAAQLYLAAGLAMAQKNSHPEHTTLVFLKGESCHGREWESALRFVVAQKLGLVIVCDGAARPGKPGANLTEEPGSRYAAIGLPPVLQVDRGDAIAVYRVTQEAMTHARHQSRPTIIRAFGPREIGAIDPHAALDPIKRMELYLRNKAIRPEGIKATTQEAFLRKINRLSRKNSNAV